MANARTNLRCSGKVVNDVVIGCSGISRRSSSVVFDIDAPQSRICDTIAMPRLVVRRSQPLVDSTSRGHGHLSGMLDEPGREAWTVWSNRHLKYRYAVVRPRVHQTSTEQEFSGGSISLTHQFPLIDGGQFLDCRLHSAGFRLVHAGEPDEQPCRWICAGVPSPSAGDVLCVTHRHIPSDTSVDCPAAAQDEVDIPALRRSCSRRQRAG